MATSATLLLASVQKVTKPRQVTRSSENASHCTHSPAILKLILRTNQFLNNFQLHRLHNAATSSEATYP